MTDLLPVTQAAIYLVPTLVWAVLCERTWFFVRTRRPRSWLFRMLPLVAALVTVHLVLNTTGALIPPELRAAPPPLLIGLATLNDLCVIASLALFRHLLCFVPMGGARPGRAWLAANYVPAALLAALALAKPLLPAIATGHLFHVATMQLYSVVMFVLIVRQMMRIARRGVWGPGGLHEVRRPDVVVLAVVAVGTGALLAAILVWGGGAQSSTAIVLLDASVHLAVALPLAVRLLGEVLRGFLVGTAAIVATAGVYVGAHGVSAHIDSRLGPVIDLGAVLALGLLLVPGQAWLRGAVEHVVFRRTRQRQGQLLAFLHALSPELGAAALCRRALPEFTRVMQLSGTAILLADGGEPIVHGDVRVDRLRLAWADHVASTEARFAGGFGMLEMLELPVALREPLRDAGIIGVFPLASPRRRWGHLFMTAGLLGTAISDEDVQVINPFVDQLALMLDAAELLARAVAVERSLAHAEKLAAIGELAARIAHDIRNPVTAARSLAQQLAAERESPLHAEHELILTELERVERQVGDLLRFARREEFRFEPVDLGQLVEATVDQLRPRLEAAAIGVELAVGSGVTTRVDPEKMRHVLINLIENAMDALVESPNGRQLGVKVAAGGGRATLDVSDNGPGVPREALARLFEPFFSLKANGTGLGLAIARRTVEAHGGRIAAHGADTGMTFHIELPTVDPA